MQRGGRAVLRKQGDVGRRIARRFEIGCGRRRAVRIRIEAAPRLAPEEARVHEFLLDQRRRVARIVEVRAEHRFGHREVHVVADQVHQLERPHPEAAGLAHHRVDRCRRATLLVQHAQRLRVIRPRDAVHDEARRRFRHHGPLAPCGGGGIEHLRDLWRGREPAHHLDERHQRRRVEEMQAGDALRHAQPGRDRRDRDRRRVGGQQARVVDMALKGREDLALHVEPLRRRLDDQCGAREIGQFTHRANPGACRVGLGRFEPALLGEPRELRADAGQRLVAGGFVQVEQQHRMAGRRRDLRNARAHRAGTDHADDGRRRQRARVHRMCRRNSHRLRSVMKWRCGLL
ncbi:hypothetical protein BLA6863_00606 [Burkholderia lata]|uniref:Uncharacterized protein n=1 Tax=Burkholderia lata (strain ATCC 17760 / DSM 23089 / LMG 22485 / NCIMB 9086 / R18194 / 383) TaxID=482957 RepID=A0A6P2HHT8_BURL3|nr:hypothetical protein BLA6863_00606 [Burkholderia lata]